MRPFFAAAVAACALTLPAPEARATGGFGCRVEDASLKLAADSAFSHGLGGVFLNFGAKAEIPMAGVPDDLKTIDLGRSLVHHWLDGGELRLHFYRERDGNEMPHAYVEIVLKTAGESDEEDFQGTYSLTVFVVDETAEGGSRMLTAEGKAGCSVG